MANGNGHDGGLGAWWAAILAGAGGVVIALAAFFKDFFPARAAAKKAAAEILAADKQQAHDIKMDSESFHQKRIETLEAEVSGLHSEISRLKDIHFEQIVALKDKTYKEINDLTMKWGVALADNATLRGELQQMRVNVQRLQGITGDAPPKHSLPIPIVVDTDGKIYDVGPAIGGLLQYLKSELVGRNIEMLVPERHRESHLAGLAKIRDNRSLPLRELPILTEALAKDKTEVPIALSLKSSWPLADNSGKMKIYGEMQDRSSIIPLPLKDPCK